MAEKQDWYVEAKDKPCMDCGNTFDPSRGVKQFAISERAYKPLTPAIEQELAKCDLVCRSCHSYRTNRRKKGMSHAERWNLDNGYGTETPW